jgi:hypothetical protein
MLMNTGMHSYPHDHTTNCYIIFHVELWSMIEQLLPAGHSWSVQQTCQQQANKQLTVIPGQNPIVIHDIVIYILGCVIKGLIILCAISINKDEWSK